MILFNPRTDAITLGSFNCVNNPPDTPAKVITPLLSNYTKVSHLQSVWIPQGSCNRFLVYSCWTTAEYVGQASWRVRSSIAFLDCITFVAVLPCCTRFGWEPGWEELLFLTVDQFVSFLQTTHLDTLWTCMTLSNFLWDCRLYSLYSIPYNNSA